LAVRKLSALSFIRGLVRNRAAEENEETGKYDTGVCERNAGSHQLN